MNKCRCCGAELSQSPFLIFKNAPIGAQSFISENETSTVEKKSDMYVYQCEYCNLVQLTNRPVPYYKNVIRSASVSEDVKKFRKVFFDDFIKKFNLEEKKIIEIGSGKGEFLNIISQNAKYVYGIENDEEAVQICVENGLKVLQGFIENEDTVIAGSPYDAFYILNFLEHIPNPKNFLRCIWNNLSDDAVGIIEVPDFDIIYKNNMFAEFIPDHLVYYTRQTLCNVLYNSGFDIIEIKSICDGYVLSAIVKKHKKINYNGLKKQKQLLERQFLKIKNSFDRIAIWGASHQTLLLLSLMEKELTDKIKFVIDSAEFKQGKYTPVAQKKIVSPKVLMYEKVDLIIIIAGSYAEEIFNLLMSDYNVNYVCILKKNELHFLKGNINGC